MKQMKYLVVLVILIFVSAIGGGVQAKTESDWINNGTAYDQQGRYSDAIEAYSQAINLNATSVTAWFKKAISYYKDERYSAALEAIQKTTELDPQNATAWYYQGKINEILKNNDDAVTANNKARMLGYIV
jgi:tetratricopeptide (TPR) repeat protein